ncbi:hypothetical protein ADL03_07400 [Nocardia sp. NRRL S-836]|nr:hypothetical protein ADL03_07400 [Nocardia sp. NRRL S-836]
MAGLARVLRTPRALFGSQRPTAQLGTHVAWAGQAVENYRRVVAELLHRMDGHIQVGRPSVEEVVELGVQHPREADSAEIAADLRTAVDARLAGQVPLPVLAQELRLVAANSGPQGCTAALDDVSRRGPLALAMPGFRRWPLPLPALPLEFLACGLLTVLLGPGAPGWGTGLLLALLWFGAGWLLLARRPGQAVEDGFAATAAPAVLAYGLPAVLGVAAGVVVTLVVADRVAMFSGELLTSEQFGLSSTTGVVVAVVLFLLTAAVAALSWRSAVRAWRGELRLVELENAVADLTRIAEDVAVREWQPMRRRLAIAAAATEVAGGLEEIAQTLREAGNRLFIAPPSDVDSAVVRPVPQELYAVVRGDLTDVCRGALDPAWPAAANAIRTAEGVYAQRLDRLLGEYGAEVRRHGLMAAGRFSRDHAPRDALMARMWSESPEALLALRTEATGDMTQLCRSGQLGYLSTSAGAGLVRFGPARLRRVLEHDGVHSGLAADPGITWGEGGDLVGAVRLLPLRPESVRQVLGGDR